MKYANSLKYINSFVKSESSADISQKRVRCLCSALGRVNVGCKFIVVPYGCAGHASAVMLECVIKSAGYRVGRITSDADFESRSTVFLGGETVPIDDYNKCVAELKSIVSKTPDEHYLKEEICFALSLLLCKLYGCEFIILEGLCKEYSSLESICAPYELVLAPTVYSGENTPELFMMCDAVKRGVREVVSGNQKNAVYSEISNACMLTGVRLNVPAKPTFQVSETTARRVTFSYAERDGYVLKSPSLILRDCAMLVIESALALRRDGVKLPWASIQKGLENCKDTVCFDILSVSPSVIVDSASEKDEILSLIETFEETVEHMERVTVCIKTDDICVLKEQLRAFEDKKIDKLIALGICADDISKLSGICADVAVCKSEAEAARAVHSAWREKQTVLCIGSVAFAREVKTEYIKLMGL